MIFSNALSPLCVSVGNCTRVSALENSSEIWKAEVKLGRHGRQKHDFPEVFFVEIPEKVSWIWGILPEDAPDIDNLLPVASARAQRDFLSKLRFETARGNESLGDLSRIFFGHEFSSEGKVMAAYMASRGLSHEFGVAYVDDNGIFQRISMHPGEDSGFIAGDQSLEEFDQWFHDSILESNNG